MIYIVRECLKDGGQEFTHPDDAIDAAVDWELATGKPCEIYMAWPPARPPFVGGYRELFSGPHTAEVRQQVDYVRHIESLQPGFQMRLAI